MNKLVGKIFIKGKIVTQTGLHIGGSKSSLDIGGIDLNVIKTPQGTPFIPGSSLKGKLRSMLARLEGSEDVKTDTDKIKRIFGNSGDNDKERGQATRLLVRDATLDTAKFDADFAGTELDASKYTDSKWENTINRKTGTAEHPRQLERVPSGAEFDFELVYDRFADKATGVETDTANDLTLLRTAMRLLEGDYIGGSGSRGYGKIRFENVTCITSEIKEADGIFNLEAEKAYDFTF
jgi:CRISPR-associated protein Csm3